MHYAVPEASTPSGVDWKATFEDEPLNADTKEDLRVAWYRLERIRSEHENHFIMVAENLTTFEAMGRLIDGYPGFRPGSPSTPWEMKPGLCLGYGLRREG
jgi:hypothetical protein